MVAGTAAPPHASIDAAVPAAVVVGSEAAGAEPDPNPIACADYDAHRSLDAHRWQDGQGWVCHACEAVA